MSVIAWDGKTLAADKRASFGTLILTTTKIHRVGDAIAGYAGEPCFGSEVIEWLRRGCAPKDFPASQRDKDDWCGVLLLRPGQPIHRYERSPYPIVFEDRFIAIGSGRDFAMAAMHLGHDARRAVEVACALDTSCGNGVDVLTLDGVVSP